MQKENNLTAGQWCDHWFTANRHKWNSNTEGGYRNLIYSHIIPSIGGVVLSGLTKQTIINFYDSLRSQGLGARSVWCVHLLLRRCMDEAAQDQLIPYNPVRLCQEPKAEEYKTAPLRLGQLQRYLNAAEQLGVLPLIYTGLKAWRRRRRRSRHFCPQCRQFRELEAGVFERRNKHRGRQLPRKAPCCRAFQGCLTAKRRN